jgi:signal transduction histidine kinase
MVTVFDDVLYIAVIPIIVVAILLQNRRMVGRMSDRLEIHRAARERIARELQDILLQGIQGLILQFQAVAEHIPEESPLRAQIDQALDRADSVLVESRGRVHDFYTSDHGLKDLGAAFAWLGQTFAEYWPPTFQLVFSGERQDIEAVVEEEIYLIGREALLNAFQHARALGIEVELAFEVKQFRLCVRDDGVGIPSSIVEEGRRSGRWGLVGMRERAHSIGGQLEIQGHVGLGTKVELVVPSGIVYRKGYRASWASLKRLLGVRR